MTRACACLGGAASRGDRPFAGVSSTKQVLARRQTDRTVGIASWGATELAAPEAAHVSEVVGVAAAAAVALDFPADGTGACAPALGHGVLVR